LCGKIYSIHIQLNSTGKLLPKKKHRNLMTFIQSCHVPIPSYWSCRKNSWFIIRFTIKGKQVHRLFDLFFYLILYTYIYLFFILLHYYFTTLLHCYVATLLYYYITTLLHCYIITLLLHYYCTTTLLLHYYITTSLLRY